jgi:hypothetical protein
VPTFRASWECPVPRTSLKEARTPSPPVSSPVFPSLSHARAPQRSRSALLESPPWESRFHCSVTAIQPPSLYSKS